MCVHILAAWVSFLELMGFLEHPLAFKHCFSWSLCGGSHTHTPVESLIKLLV